MEEYKAQTMQSSLNFGGTLEAICFQTGLLVCLGFLFSWFSLFWGVGLFLLMERKIFSQSKKQRNFSFDITVIFSYVLSELQFYCSVFYNQCLIGISACNHEPTPFLLP